MPRLIIQAAKPSEKDTRPTDVWVVSSHTDWRKILPLVIAKLEEITAE